MAVDGNNGWVGAGDCTEERIGRPEDLRPFIDWRLDSGWLTQFFWRFEREGESVFFELSVERPDAFLLLTVSESGTRVRSFLVCCRLRDVTPAFSSDGRPENDSATCCSSYGSGEDVCWLHECFLHHTHIYSG
jgi:hypothetical protein